MNIQDFMICFNEKAKNYTFMFELTSPYNRIVCKYDDISLTFIGIRNNFTFKEEDPKLWLNYKTDTFGLKTAKEYDFVNIPNMLDIVNSWKPDEHEGIVIRDENFNRIKVKNVSYVLFNKTRDSLSTSIKGCIEAILLEKDDDLIPMMPKLIVNRLTKLKPVIKEVFHKIEEDYNEIKHIDNMKEFASYAEFKFCPPALYALKRKKVNSIKEFSIGKMINGRISNSNLNMILNLCEKIDSSIKNLTIEIKNILG